MRFRSRCEAAYIATSKKRTARRRMQTARHRSKRRGKMREEATSRAAAAAAVAAGYHHPYTMLLWPTSPTCCTCAAQQRLRSDERMDWRCSAEPYYTTGLGLVVLSTLFKVQYGFSAPSAGRETNFHHDSCNLRGIFLANPVCCHGHVGCNESRQIQVKRSNSLLLVRCSR